MVRVLCDGWYVVKFYVMDGMWWEVYMVCGDSFM